MTTTPLFDRSAFALPPALAHVCAAGESAPLLGHAHAFSTYLRDKASGMAGREAQEAVIARVRDRVGAMWNVPARDVGFVSNVAEGVSMLAESIDWRPGDAVCLESNEFPSLVAPFLAGTRDGPAIRFARGSGPDRLLEAIDGGTRLVVVSHVSYLNGERFDLAKLRARADEVGAMLVVDYTQAAGYLPIDASIADFAFGACYKFLLGVTGVAIAIWNAERQPGWRPSTAGWYSLGGTARPDHAKGVTLRPDALRFTRGNPSHVSLYVLDNALAFLSGHDATRVEAHVLALAGDLHARLSAFGLTPSTPADPRRHGANVCLDGDYPDDVVAEIERRGVRLWGNRGRLRVSFHGYNAGDDVDRVMEVLPAVLRG